MGRDDLQARGDLERGRACYEQRRWADAVDALLRAQRVEPLAREDLDRLAWSAALIGDDDQFLKALESLYQACTGIEDWQQAAKAAFWIGFRLVSTGAAGRGAGWLARAQRHVDDVGRDCAERGYLLLPTIFRQLGENENVAAEDAARKAVEIGRSCGDADLIAIARNLQGRALLYQSRVDAGLALLDEVMISVTSGELSPLVTGLVYCNVLTTCQRIHAFDRAREWTDALASWCGRQPQLITFTGSCLVHRSEIMQLGGDWPQALEEVRQICEHVCREEDPEVFAAACYQRGELLRLRGDFAASEAAYQLANQHGRDPQPGMALLRMAQGRLAEAASSINRVVSTTKPVWRRAQVLPAFIEIMLAAGQLGDAHAAADELQAIARDFGTEILGAMAAHAHGAVRLVEDDPQSAVQPLQHALSVWHRVGAPYIAARIRVLLAAAYRELGDHGSADLELAAARGVFEQLGAKADLSALGVVSEARDNAAQALSRRELEVLCLVASGMTNKAIAAQLSLSERTIDRHVSNIFAKIQVSSRSAATAFAYQHKIV